MLNNWLTMSWLWLLANTAASNQIDYLKPLKDFLESSPRIKAWLTVFAVIVLATATIAKWTGNLDKIIVFVQKYLFRKKPEFTEAQRQQARSDLIEILLKQVVKRLEDSLHHKIRIDLRREEQRQRVGKGNLAPVQEEETEHTPDNFIKRTFNPFTETAPPEAVSTNKSTQELFEQEDIQGRLLILGEPGSGKTNELLQLARDLLIQAQKSPEEPIPVIFELSEWNTEKEFEDWLAQLLRDKYNVPIIVSKHWIQQKQLLPLLDGLDELRRVEGNVDVISEEFNQRQTAKQIKCVRNINKFLDMYTLPLVVCCRRKEYEDLEVKGEYLKRLNGAIYLQALDDDQVHGYLQKLNRKSLWIALQNQPELLELTHPPLFLLILVVAYQGQHIRSTEELLDEYIHKQLNDLNNQGTYPPSKAPTPEETQHYLSWLASKLEYVGTTEFLIEQLQPSWLDTSKARKHYRWICGLIYGLSAGLIYGLIGGLNGGLIGGLIVGLIYGLSLGLNDELSNITTLEKLNFSWSTFYRVGLIVGLIYGLLYGLSLGLSLGLIGGLIYGLSLGLIGGLISGLKTSQIDARDKINPNQGIKDSIRNGLIVGLSAGLSFGLSFGLGLWLAGGFTGGLIGGLMGGLNGGLMGGLMGGLHGGLYLAYQHISLRIVLYQSGVAPWNYARFLEHAENHRFIQRTGGRYRFVHDLLRKRFAATLKQP